MGGHVPDDDTIESLDDRTHGPVLTPGDEGYDEARAVWNGMIDKHPAAIARCTGAADVIAAVETASEHDLLVSVKGAGHNVAGTAVCDDGLVIDCGPMDGVRVDPDREVAVVEPGATWADVDHETQAFGLATTGGVASITGVAGLTLGGGIGHLARSYGLACDNLVGADVVTADGDLVRASESEHPDLFWALRGGGGNFGVVTAFEFELHDVGPEILAGPIFHHGSDAREVLYAYRETMAEAPPSVACYALFAMIPPEPPFDETVQGDTALILVPSYSGTVEEGEAALAPFREIGEPILDGVQPIPYTALQQSFDDGQPEGNRYYFKSHYMAELPDEAIETAVEHAVPVPAPFTMLGFEPMGGAVSAVDPDETAYPHRDAQYNFGIFAGWVDPDRDDEMIAWTREFHDAMAPFATGGMYANYLDRDEQDRTDAAFGANHDRLVEVKTVWDPENLFRMNQNVVPEE